MVVLATIAHQKAINYKKLGDYLRTSHRAIGTCNAANYPA
jgi:hypothetical protein